LDAWLQVQSGVSVLVHMAIRF